MPRCPYAPHRLFSQGGVCRRCGGDVRLYAGVRILPGALFNSARRLWGQGDPEAAAAVLVEALRLRPEFPEAHWLMAAIETVRGRLSEARASLAEAARLGAAVDPSWLDAPRPNVIASPVLRPDDAATLQMMVTDEVPPTALAPEGGESPFLPLAPQILVPGSTALQSAPESKPAVSECRDSQPATRGGALLRELRNVLKPRDRTPGESDGSAQGSKE